MKETSRSSIELFFPQILPPVSFQQFTCKHALKEKLLRTSRRHRKIIEFYLAVLGVSSLFLIGTYLFCVQLAEHGW